MPKENKTRIYTVFEPEIILDELSMRDYSQDESERQQLENQISMQYPLVKINSYIFGDGEIESLKIDSTDFLPTISITFITANKLFLSRDFPKDGDIASVMIRHNSDVLKPVRNDYIITGASSRKFNTDINGSIVTIHGELFVPGLKSFFTDLYSWRGTSMEVLKQIAKRLELGFSTNENDTDDEQVWYTQTTVEEVINHITENAWKDEDSFFDCWIDIYYNLNFINVQSQLLSSEESVDIGALLSNIDGAYNRGINTTEENTKETPKVFSNFEEYRNTSFYIYSWKPINRSTNITFNYGSNMTPGFFEHLSTLYEDPNAQKYWAPTISPKYDSDKVDKFILLRGRPTYDPATDESQARANYSIPDIYKKSPWLGVQYTINNPEENTSQWTGNHHRNYLRAKVHNTINLVELDKLNVDMSVRGKNFNIIKGDKLPIAIIKKDPLETKRMFDDLTGAQSSLDRFYSGWYYVKGFVINYNDSGGRGDSTFSRFTQKFILTRREWPTPEPTENE